MNKKDKSKLQQLIDSINQDKPLIEVLKEQGISEEGIKEFAEMQAELLLRRYTDE